jgi:hypothetical protein
MQDTIEFHLKQGGKLFDSRSSLLSLWQEIADNFYPERADFTTIRNVGQEFADHLTTSYPLLARRDLGNALGSMLRPTSKEWFRLRTSQNWENLGTEARAWLEWASSVQKRAMYNRRAQFTRATKEADHDFATFGQAVIQTSLNKNADGLLYRCWHLRDVAWRENDEGMVDTVYRKWKPTARELSILFPGKVHQSVTDKLESDPFCEFNVWHCIVPSDYMPDGRPSRTPFKSYYIDVDNKHIMEQVGIFTMEYVIPRWQTVSGSQYAYSPSTVAALPDARLIQAMTRVLLEAGEKATNPPMIAVQEALRSDISIYAGGVTWVDSEYDERMGEVLRPLTQDTRGIPLGRDMARDTQQMIAECFFLNKLSMPPSEREMTAYEVGQRVQEYIRQAMPLFEPMEAEYNAPICENTFSLMLRAGAFGSPMDMPRELQGMGYEFAFESPLHDATERQKGQRFLEAKSMMAEAVAIDPSASAIIDVKIAFRDVLQSIGTPSKWMRSENDVAAIEQQQQQQQQTAQLLDQMQQGSDIAKTMAEAQAQQPTQAQAVV